jgi:hypothetical protein
MTLASIVNIRDEEAVSKFVYTGITYEASGTLIISSLP